MKFERAYKITTADNKSLYDDVLRRYGMSVQYSTKSHTALGKLIFVFKDLELCKMMSSRVWIVEGIFLKDPKRISTSVKLQRDKVKLHIDPESYFMRSVRLVEELKF